MAVESKMTQVIVAELTDIDAKRPEEWVSSWLGELFDTYEKMPNKGLADGYRDTIDPLIFWLAPEQRQRLGEALWQDRREWLASHVIKEPYPFTGLAEHLYMPVSGS